MDTLKFGSLPSLYPLVSLDDTPGGFLITPSELYDPQNGTRVESPSATEYQATFLVPIDDFALIKTQVNEALDTFDTTGEITQIPVVVDVAEDNVVTLEGTYQVFWVQATFERYNDLVLVTLKGFGEPDSGSVAPNQHFTVTEGAANGTVVGTIKGFKPGILLDSRPDIPFSYQPSSGVLSVSGTIDYEKASEWSLTIGGTEVIIWVIDAPENPLPTQSTYTFYLAPDANAGTVAGTVTAEVQGDSGVRPSYSLVSGNTGGWAIDSISGDITYLGTQPLVDGQVLGVGYGGTEPLTVTLRVLPPSVITLPILRYALPATFSDGMLVGTVGATGVKGSLVNPGFEVTDNKLYVVNKTLVEPGLVELEVNLEADGRSGTQQVFVVVADHLKVNEFWVSEDTTNGTTIGTVELGAQGGGSYTVSPTTVFNINAGTGELIVTNATLLSAGNYSLTVTKGSQSTLVTIKVYAVLSSNTLEFTVAPSTPSGTVLGTIAGQASFTTTGSISPYSLNPSTGVITLASTPPTAATFTVTDGAGDTTEVSITLETATGAVGFIGAVYPGQVGQAIVTRAGVLFSVGSVGFGQGSLGVKPDNLGSVTRNTEGKLVASKASGTSLPLTAQATAEMVTALKALWAQPIENQVTVAVLGTNYLCHLVNFELSYGAEGVSVTLDLRTP